MAKNAEFVAVITTCPDMKCAKKLAALLVEDSAAACVNVLPGITSYYRWEGKVESAGEVLLIAKTVRSSVPRVQAILLENHPYSIPEMIVLPILAGEHRYLEWILASVETP